jgi:transposase
MRQVNGVGALTALAYVLALDNDAGRVKRSRQAGAMVGLRPKQRDSGQSAPQLGITKCGDKLLRRLLVQSAQYQLGPFGQDSALRQWGLKLAAGTNRRAKRRAVVAVARKLAVLLHVLWSKDVDYDPFYGITPEKAA